MNACLEDLLFAHLALHAVVVELHTVPAGRAFVLGSGREPSAAPEIVDLHHEEVYPLTEGSEDDDVPKAPGATLNGINEHPYHEGGFKEQKDPYILSLSITCAVSANV